MSYLRDKKNGGKNFQERKQNEYSRFRKNDYPNSYKEHNKDARYDKNVRPDRDVRYDKDSRYNNVKSDKDIRSDKDTRFDKNGGYRRDTRNNDDRRQKNDNFYNSNSNESTQNPPETVILDERPPVKSNECAEPNNENDFDKMNLKQNLLRGVYAYGFDKPSKIQQQSIPILKTRKDLIIQSQSGTGKTGAFSLGILEVIDETKNYVQSIIITPTRELCVQINSIINELGKFMKIQTALCVGGSNVEENIFSITNGAHIIVGTPGRIFDLIRRKTFDPKKVQIFCMDEADELLKKEFLIQIKDIVTTLNRTTQICVVSATVPRDLLELTKGFMNNAEHILVEQEKLSLSFIVQFYIDVEEDRYKLATLEDLYKNLSIAQSIIYVNHKDKADWLKEKLIAYGHCVEAIHSNLSAVERSEIMKKFRSGIYRVLISTDLLARGIDIQQVGYVINYDLPYDPDSYLHRIGRSGRYGKKGVAINFVSRRERNILYDLQEKFKIKINEMPELSDINMFLVA